MNAVNYSLLLVVSCLFLFHGVEAQDNTTTTPTITAAPAKVTTAVPSPTVVNIKPLINNANTPGMNISVAPMINTTMPMGNMSGMSILYIASINVTMPVNSVVYNYGSSGTEESEGTAMSAMPMKDSMGAAGVKTPAATTITVNQPSSFGGSTISKGISVPLGASMSSLTGASGLTGSNSGMPFLYVGSINVSMPITSNVHNYAANGTEKDGTVGAMVSPSKTSIGHASGPIGAAVTTGTVVQTASSAQMEYMMLETQVTEMQAILENMIESIEKMKK